MKFIKLESRGGNYLVVAANVAWLRTAENGQTSVGIIGGQPLLVVGSVEEVAAKILAGVAEGETADEAAAEKQAPAPEASAEEVAAVVVEAAEPEVAEPAPIAETPEAVPVAPAVSVPPKPKVKSGAPLTLADRLARAAAPSVKAGTQRFMSMSE
jgi:periplasmic protein TonB